MMKRITFLAGLLWCVTSCMGAASQPARMPGWRAGSAPARSDSRSGSTGAGKAPSDAEASAIITRSAQALRSLAQVLDRAGEDCDAMARGLGMWIQANQQELAENFAAAMQIPEARRAELMQRELGNDESVHKVWASLHACTHHPGVSAAMERLQAITQ